MKFNIGDRVILIDDTINDILNYGIPEYCIGVSGTIQNYNPGDGYKIHFDNRGCWWAEEHTIVLLYSPAKQEEYIGEW